MSQIDLKRISILIVEDNQFLRSLIVDCLRIIGIGSVKSVSDGSEAVELIKLMTNDPVRAGIMDIDMIIADWEMSPIDGFMLLRWIRRHKDSFDRFLPFIMLTGYSEIDRVEKAREMGVNEFITKPFSIHTVAEKLLSIIDKPRQFVHTGEYFGPDRRRSALPHKGQERRILTDNSQGVEIING